ncbi:hypothetical protein [Neisseria sp. 74A18]|uniref:hypothetical protein n=1 Tax=Neisseria sp. 74A18 TaxID=1696094 RepID=UPI0006CE6E15|nr:hypothetical protein [Neisseria sp. 74A18]KPN72774.1 hypothetical protein AKG43_11485 [Neisseria sp. 74A18]
MGQPLAAFPPFGGIFKNALGRFLALVAYPASSLKMGLLGKFFVFSRGEVRVDLDIDVYFEYLRIM